MLNVAVIGCGWLGLPLAVSFINKKYSVIGTTTSSNKIPDLKELGISSFLLDLTKSIKQEHLFFLEKVDVFVVNIPPSKLKGDKSYSEILLEFVKLIPINSKVILVSTTGVYPEILKIAEESYEFSESDLNKETVQAEIKLQNFLKNRLTILRLAGLIGVNRHPVKFLAGKKDLPNGYGPINLIHLEDAIGLINKIISVKFWGEIVNGCYPFHPSKSYYYIKKAALYSLIPPVFLEEGEDHKMVSEVKSKIYLNYEYTVEI